MAFASDTDNVELGPAEVSFGVAASEASLGFTEGGVEITMTTSRQDLVTDQLGTTPVKSVVTGRTFEVSTPLAEYDLQNLDRVIPGGVLVIDDSDSTKVRLSIKSDAGLDLITIANSLLIKKAQNGVATANKKHWLRFLKAAPSGDMTFGFSKDSQMVFPVTWIGYPTNAPTDSTIVIFGDETASGAEV